jgi:thiol:disulfide interchange protein DsbD
MGTALFQKTVKVIFFSLAVLFYQRDVLANPVVTPYTQVQLVSEVSAFRPGEPFWVALRLQLRDGWHTYWRNPGDSGLATTIDWELPAGVEVSAIHWPYPERIPFGPLMNYGYHQETYLLSRISPPAEWSVTTPLTLRAQATWLVCQEDCIPEEAALSLTLPAVETEAVVDGRWVDAFARTRRALPMPSPWSVSFTATADTFTLRFPAVGMAKNANLWFFPMEGEIIDQAAPQDVKWDPAGITLNITRGALRTTEPKRLQGVLVIQEQGDGSGSIQAFSIDALPAAAVADSTVAPERLLSLPKALLLALLGGLFLNVMPCVFPVLSIKALHLLEYASKSPVEVRRHGLAYTVGVLSCFALIASLLLALRLGGAQLGWGFQLQSPLFVTLLAWLMMVMGFSLSGVFSLGGSLMGIGSGLADRSGYSGSFFSGMLATVVATPCTGPFMAVALGFALLQPWPVALTVFLALGFGLALPYLSLSFSPRLVRLLPRPGPWMVRLKELLAFPLYATTIWLVWVLSLQSGAQGTAIALTGIVLLAFAAWLFQSTRSAQRSWQLVGSSSVAVILLVALPALLTGLRELTADPKASALPDSAQRTGQGPAWEAFSPERLAALRATKQPVFINFTAAWCITCLSNERLVLSSPRLANYFAAQGIAYLKADWTRRNPDITRTLNEFGRNGVPLYVYYPPAATEPVVLPQLLTEAIVLEQLKL